MAEASKNDVHLLQLLFDKAPGGQQESSKMFHVARLIGLLVFQVLYALFKFIPESCKWVFPKIVLPQNGWFIRETPIKMGCFGG